jgi:mono/diheme cytochrome c family protein
MTTVRGQLSILSLVPAADAFVMKILTSICALLFSAASMFGQAAVPKDAAVTAVTGESWLNHLHRSFDETSMGKTWRLGPADSATDQPPSDLRPSTLSGSASSGARMETLHGSDLYRLNCQGCHGESGRGAPPEIGSLIDPVRATSAALVEERMEEIGMVFSRRQTMELVNQSRGALLKRLHEGGKDMPSFHHLSEAEIRALVAYLRQLAGVPGAEKEQVAIQESHARVGELIAKSTCRVCHGATGINPTPTELSEGAIPPLSALPVRVNRTGLVRKVTRGMPVIMGATSLTYRGRMPVFDYLSQNEAADVYDYLTHYPPTELASVSQTFQPSLTGPTELPVDREPIDREGVRAPQIAPSQVLVSRDLAESFVLPVSMGMFVAALLMLGCWITWREFRRLSVESQARASSRRPGVDPALWIKLPPTVELFSGSPRLHNEAMEGKPSDWMDQKSTS